MPRDYSYPLNWAEISKERKKTDGYKCVKCGATTGLSVHHVVPLSRGGDNGQSNLRTLCETHHKSEHRHMSRVTGRFRRRG